MLACCSFDCEKKEDNLAAPYDWRDCALMDCQIQENPVSERLHNIPERLREVFWTAEGVG